MSKVDIHSGQVDKPRQPDPSKGNVSSGQDAKPKRPFMSKVEIHSGQVDKLRQPDPSKGNVSSGQDAKPKQPDLSKVDIHSGHVDKDRQPGKPKGDVHSGQGAKPKQPDLSKAYVHSSQVAKPRQPGQSKGSVHSGQVAKPIQPDKPKGDVHSGQGAKPKHPDLSKGDIPSAQVAKPRHPDQTKGGILSDHAARTSEQEQSSSRQLVPKQPQDNTRFLTNFKLCGNNLKRLLDEKVRQDPDKIRRCNEIVHHLVTFMQKNCGVSEVVKGGSLGKGTSIREKVDIDLVVFMKRFTSVNDLQQQHKEVMREMKKHILKDLTFPKQLHYSYDTKHSNRFSLRADDSKGLIPVDLLPACNIGGGSKSTFREMARQDQEARSFYSVSFVKDQVRFTKEKPETVKDAIRLVKDWKTREKLNISSYTTEIITSKEWERMGRPDKPDLNQLFKRTMIQMSDVGNINVAWSNSRVTEETGPVVMDPANPFNNTASMIDRSDQEVIERKAREVVNWLN